MGTAVCDFFRKWDSRKQESTSNNILNKNLFYCSRKLISAVTGNNETLLTENSVTFRISDYL